MSSDFTVIINEYMPLRELVFTTLRQAILKGEIQPGERLMEIQLAEKMGVSRTPIREAIRKLANEGLVTMIPRKGAVVAGISEKILMDVLQKLVDRGNTVIIIEHNLDVIKLADWLIDMGPEGGRGGGQLLFAGTPEEMAKSKKGYTCKFLAPLLKKK